jgi:hypothetical protein
MSKNALILVNTVFAVLNFIGYAEYKKWHNLVVGILCTAAVFLLIGEK